MTGHDEFTMDFVADDEHAVTEADVAHACQLFSCPHASGWVVGVAEQKDFCVRVSAFRFEVFPIDFIAVVLHLERILCQDAPVVADTGEEAVIDGCLDEHNIAGLCDALDDGGDGGHDSAGVDEGLSLDGPSVATGKPLDGGLVEAFGHEGVAEATVLYAFLECLLDARGYLEVHVCHPHGDDVGVGKLVPLDAVGAFSVDGGVEVVGHGFVFLGLFRFSRAA